MNYITNDSVNISYVIPVGSVNYGSYTAIVTKDGNSSLYQATAVTSATENTAGSVTFGAIYAVTLGTYRIKITGDSSPDLDMAGVTTRVIASGALRRVQPVTSLIL